MVMLMSVDDEQLQEVINQLKLKNILLWNIFGVLLQNATFPPEAEDLCRESLQSIEKLVIKFCGGLDE